MKEISVNAGHKEEGGDLFLRNVGCLSKNYAALYPRR
jgi:hypothetical protein